MVFEIESRIVCGDGHIAFEFYKICKVVREVNVVEVIR